MGCMVELLEKSHFFSIKSPLRICQKAPTQASKLLERKPKMNFSVTTMNAMFGDNNAYDERYNIPLQSKQLGVLSQTDIGNFIKLIAVYYVQTLVANLHSWVWKFPKVWGRAQVCSSRKTTKRPYPQLSQKTASCYWCWKGRCKLLIGDHPSI